MLHVGYGNKYAMPYINRKFLRQNILITIVCLMSCVLIAKLYILQVQNSEKYMVLSDKNRIRLTPLTPKRGRIITSDGKVVAGNSCRYRLVMDYSDAKTFSENMKIINDCISITESEKQDILEARRQARAYHLPITVKNDLPWDEYAKIAMSFFKLKNVSIESTYVRNYELPYEFSHVVGYTSAVNCNGMRNMVGKTGVEHLFNTELSGIIGNTQMEVNSVGKKVRIIDVVAPVDGQDIILSIDSNLQKYVYELLSAHKAGACVVLDISSGEVLALVSVPGFDISTFSQKITTAQWKQLTNDGLFPLLNRTCSCTYPPGSIFKIAVALTALEHGISPKEKVYCSGGFKLDNHVFHCWNRGGHGYVNMSEALIYSCDCYFFEISKRLGIDNIVAGARELGYGESSGIELPNESSGLLPTKKWKFLKYGTTWKPYETIIAGIGQGAILATLMQSANMMGKVFTNNKNFKATLIKGNSKLSKTTFNAEYLSVIRDALYQVCKRGTAAGSCNAPYGIYGKTGSSQVRSIRDNSKNVQWKHKDHAFFVGCAPYHNPKYVVAVFVEHGGGGGSVAAPIARKVFDKLMEKL